MPFDMITYAAAKKYTDSSLQNIGNKSAFDIAKENGFDGTVDEWLESLKGENGITPSIGENGNWFIGDTDTGVAADGSYELDERVQSALETHGLGYMDKVESIKTYKPLELNSNKNIDFQRVYSLGMDTEFINITVFPKVKNVDGTTRDIDPCEVFIKTSDCILYEDSPVYYYWTSIDYELGYMLEDSFVGALEEIKYYEKEIFSFEGEVFKLYFLYNYELNRGVFFVGYADYDNEGSNYLTSSSELLIDIEATSYNNISKINPIYLPEIDEYSLDERIQSALDTNGMGWSGEEENIYTWNNIFAVPNSGATNFGSEVKYNFFENSTNYRFEIEITSVNKENMPLKKGDKFSCNIDPALALPFKAIEDNFKYPTNVKGKDDAQYVLNYFVNKNGLMLKLVIACSAEINKSLIFVEFKDTSVDDSYTIKFKVNVYEYDMSPINEKYLANVKGIVDRRLEATVGVPANDSQVATGLYKFIDDNKEKLEYYVEDNTLKTATIASADENSENEVSIIADGINGNISVSASNKFLYNNVEVATKDDRIDSALDNSGIGYLNLSKTLSLDYGTKGLSKDNDIIGKVYTGAYTLEDCGKFYVNILNRVKDSDGAISVMGEYAKYINYSFGTLYIDSKMHGHSKEPDIVKTTFSSANDAMYYEIVLFSFEGKAIRIYIVSSKNINKTYFGIGYINYNSINNSYMTSDNILYPKGTISMYSPVKIGAGYIPDIYNSIMNSAIDTLFDYADNETDDDLGL